MSAAAATAATAAPARGLDPPESRLAELARAGGPLRRVVARLAGRLAETRGWERLGYARRGDYARERLGLSGRTLHDLACVDRRLGSLPALEAALVSGRLPWSKVRLLAGFVSPEDERLWIAHALRVSVRVLEREVRAVDRGCVEAGALAEREADGEVEDVERVQIRGSASLCFKWHRVKEYASRGAGGRLSPGTVLEMVTAETISAVGLDGSAEAEAPEGTSWSEATAAVAAPGPAGAAPQRERRASCRAAADVCTPHESGPDTEPPRAVIPPFLEPLVAGLNDADPFELDARLRRAIRLEQRLDAEIAPLLRQVTSSEYAWRARYQTLAAYARERLGMSPRKARALLQLERIGDVCPELREAYRDGCLSWVQAQILAPLLLCPVEGEWRGAWVAHAQHVTVRRLEADVDRALLLREVDPRAWTHVREHPDEAPPSRQTCARPTDLGDGWRLTVHAPAELVRLFRALLCTVRRGIERETGRLPSEAEGFEAMLDHALRSWSVEDPWLRRRLRREYAVFERDGWRCTVPGCTSRRNLHAHHIVFRSAGGSDDLENQTALCAFHHQRGVHAGTLGLRGRAPEELRFELGVRPGQPPLARYRSGDLRSTSR